MKRLATALALVMTLASGVQAVRAETLASVKERGELICGANGTLAGFGLPHLRLYLSGDTVYV